jgi:NAD(P)H-hydrate epimerase
VHDIPFLTANEMREVDRAMIEDYRIELIQMMESAGRVLATLARSRFLGRNVIDRDILVLCGTGNNGGGGLVCARRLHGWGARVRVITTRPEEEYIGIPEHQLDIVTRLGVPVSDMKGPTVLAETDLVIDAIIGYGLDGPPREDAARLIRLGNDYGAPILSLDVPSGLDVTTGTAFEPAIRATATLTLALPKVGLRGDEADEYVGELYLGDISVPPELFRRSGLAYDVGAIFARDEIIRL